MNPKQPQPVAPSGQISLADIYYILFKRKWLISFCSLCGFIAAGMAFYTWHPSYQSTAKLLVSYVADASRPIGEEGSYVSVEHPSSILESEIQILKNFENAKAAAQVMQPARILGAYQGGTNEEAAASLIMTGLRAEPMPNSQIIYLSFTHRDASLVQQVLQLMITNYLVKEQDIRQKPGDFDPVLTRRKDLITMQIADYSDKLASVLNAAGVVDPVAARAQFQTEEAAIKQKNADSRAQLVEALVLAQQHKRELPQSEATNDAAEATNAAPPPARTVAEYRRLVEHLNSLYDHEKALEQTLAPGNIQVTNNLADIAADEKKQQELEDKYPALASVVTVAGNKPAGPDPRAVYMADMDRIELLRTTISNQVDEMQRIRIEGTNLVQLESTVGELERKKASAQADSDKIDASLKALAIQKESSGRVSGIEEIEEPTPPTRDLQKAPKVIAGLGVGGIALGLGLAFLLELVLDRSFKRPHEITNRLKLPFFLTIPYMNGKMKLQLPGRGNSMKLLPPSAAPSAEENPEAVPDNRIAPLAPAFDGVIPPWDEKHALRPFHETLRDRLVAYFEEIGLTHKPKLVAVTSCDEGAGVSTIASGLASSLSETGEGNVLLVSMNSEDGEAHHFYKGRLTLGIDEVLHKDNRTEAMVQEKLYVVKESSNSEKLPSFLPKRFGHLVDKMKASDYDYIIFDMPPVTQISVTPRLARFMDTVLLVVEAEKTHHDVAQRAAALLVQSRANVGVVMNKARSYVPKRLLQEL